MDSKLTKISFLSIYPEMISPYLGRGVFRAAQATKKFAVKNLNLRDYAVDQHGSVDDKPYGGGEGMVMRCEPLAKALESFKKKPRVILTSPQGVKWSQEKAQDYTSKYEHILFVCPRFSGLDQRAIDLFVDEEVSLGDYIISGGELAALVIADSIVKHLPNAMSSKESYQKDSFSKSFSGKLEYPLYTRPPEFKNIKVPDELLSGNPKKIQKWQSEQIDKQTKTKRPDLLS